jgi:hypothetical protein
LWVLAVWLLTGWSGCVEFPDPRGTPQDGGVSAGNAGSAAGGASSGGTGAVAADSGSAGSAGAGGVAGGGGSAGAAITGLIGYWPLDDNGGVTAADLVGSRDGVFVAGEAEWTTDAKFGTALRFLEGSGLTMSDWSGSQFPGAGTISLWLYGDFEVVETKSRGVFDQVDSSRDHIYLRRSNLDDGFPYNLQIAFQTSDASFAFLDSHKLKNKTWAHVAVCWNVATDEGNYYVNGSNLLADLPTKGPNWTPSDQKFLFGHNLTGIIDEIRLYDRMLTINELNTLTAQTSP